MGISLDLVADTLRLRTGRASLNRCVPFESALRFREEGTAYLTDIERGCALSELIPATFGLLACFATKWANSF